MIVTDTESKIAGRAPLILALTVLVAVAITAAGCTVLGQDADENILSEVFSEPLGDVKAAALSIDVGNGDLTVSGLNGDDPMLVRAELQYPEDQPTPQHSLEAFNGQATFKLQPGGQEKSGLRLPWEACNSLTDWRIQLNPAAAYDLNAHSDGGNVRLELEGITLAGVTAETGGGSMEIFLPEPASSYSLSAKTGAGKAYVYVPAGTAARIRATTGLGKVTVDPRFVEVEAGVYQSADYDGAASRIDIRVECGAGEVQVLTR